MLRAGELGQELHGAQGGERETGLHRDAWLDRDAYDTLDRHTRGIRSDAAAQTGRVVPTTPA